MLNIDEMLKS